jgi:hypothetical protein
MSESEERKCKELDHRVSDQLYVVRKLGFMAAIAAIGLKWLFTGGVTFRLGETGRDIQIPALVVAIAGVTSLLAAGVITAEHIARHRSHLSERHFLRQSVVLYCAWAVVALVVVFALAGVASAA